MAASRVPRAQLTLGITRHTLEDSAAFHGWPQLPGIERQVQLGQHKGAVVGLAPKHDSVAPCERVEHRPGRDETAVDDNRQRGKHALELLHDVIAQWRYRAILLRR